MRHRRWAASSPRPRTVLRTGRLSMLGQRKAGVTVAAASADLSNAFLRSYAAHRPGSPGLTPAEIARPRAFVASVLSERGPNESSFAKVATWISGVALI